MTTSDAFTVLSTFEDGRTAHRAVDALAKEGFLPENMHVEPSDAAAAVTGPGSGSVAAPRHGLARIERFFERLLGRAGQAAHARDYSQAVGGGRSVVIVDTGSAVAAERAATVMQEFGGYDLTERRELETAAGRSSSTSGEQSLPDGTVVRWRAAHVVCRPGEPLRELARE